MKEGANVNNKSGYNGSTPMMVAAEYSHYAIVKFLIDNGGNVNYKDIYGNTAIHKASSNGRLKIVRLLINRGANINTKTNGGYTALMTATINDHKEIVSLLIENNAYINEKNHYGDTALYFACCYGHNEIVQLLLRKGANPNVKTNNDKKTPLHYACQRYRSKTIIVSLLLKNGANVNDKDCYGNTPLLIANKKRGHKEIIQTLLSYKANIFETNNTGEAAIEYIKKNMEVFMVFSLHLCCFYWRM